MPSSRIATAGATAAARPSAPGSALVSQTGINASLYDENDSFENGNVMDIGPQIFGLDYEAGDSNHESLGE